MTDNKNTSLAQAVEPLESKSVEILLDNQSQFIKFLSSKVGSIDIAQDLLQEGFVRAIESQPRFSPDMNIMGWFYSVLHNLLIDHYRRQSSATRKHDNFLKELVATNADHVELASELGKETCACMIRLLPTLLPQYAEVIERLDLKNEPLSQAADSLGISPGNLTVRLHRARRALKERLQRSCGACAKHHCLDCSCK